MSDPSYPFHFLPLKLSNKRMKFLFPLLKLLKKKEREEYSKIIFFISFHSILFPHLKQAVSDQHLTQHTHTHTNQLVTHNGKKTKLTHTQNDKKKRDTWYTVQD